MAHKIVRIGNSLGARPPWEVSNLMQVANADRPVLSEDPDGGYRLSPHHSESAAALRWQRMLISGWCRTGRDPKSPLNPHPRAAR